jgi:hypothetical protein
MSSGFHEILLIVVIILALLFIPRMTAPKSRFQKKPKRPLKLLQLGAAWRLALLVTIVWILGTTAFFRPWQGKTGLFLLIGIGPLIVGWGITWVVAGFGRDKKKS